MQKQSNADDSISEVKFNNQVKRLKMNDLKSINDSLKSVINSYEIDSDCSGAIDEILLKIQEQREDLEKRKISLFYPKQSSKDERMQEMGLTEENNALLFLSTPQSSNSLKSKLINAIELNKIDFASTIFQKLLLQIPMDENKWYELKNKNLGKYNLMLAIKTLYKNFSEQRGIGLINSELEALNELETSAIEFKQKNNKVELTIN